MTKPPPYERAPTLNATHTNASTPPVAVAAVVASRGQRCVPSRAGTAERAERELDEAAREQHEDEPGSQRGGRGRRRAARRRPSASAPSPAARLGRTRSVPGAHRDGGDRGAGTGPGAEDPGRRRGGEEHRGEAEDEHEPGQR